MKSELKRFLTWMALIAGGIAVAVLLLLGITGGFLVGTVALVLTALALTTLAVINTYAGRRGAEERPTAGEAVPAEVVPEPVVARVTEAAGVCTMGYEYRVGEVWDVNGKVEGAHPLCPVVEAKLREAGKHLRDARDGRETEKVICEAKGHRVVIELAKREAEVAKR